MGFLSKAKKLLKPPKPGKLIGKVMDAAPKPFGGKFAPPRPPGIPGAKKSGGSPGGGNSLGRMARAGKMRDRGF